MLCLGVIIFAVLVDSYDTFTISVTSQPLGQLYDWSGDSEVRLQDMSQLDSQEMQPRIAYVHNSWIVLWMHISSLWNIDKTKTGCHQYLFYSDILVYSPVCSLIQSRNSDTRV